MDKNPTINIETIMRAIRRDVFLKKTALGAPPPRLELSEKPEARDSPTRLSPHPPEKTGSLGGGTPTRVQAFLAFHDLEFVDNAYLNILRRAPDREGAAYYLQAIRGGSLAKIEVLGRLRYSPEGRREGVKIRGLMIRFAFKLMLKVPILGYLVDMITLPFRLPFIVRHLERLEASLHAEQALLREHSEARGFAQEQAIRHLARILEDFSSRQAHDESDRGPHNPTQ